MSLLLIAFPRIVTRYQEGAELALLDRLRHAADAGYRYGDRKGCMKGTRRGVLSQLERWVNDEQGTQLLWLNGLAGTGKSAIARTFAEISFADGKLGATFFCSRDFADRSDPRAVFPTLAFQLAYRYPRFREELIPVLVASPNVGRETLCSQMEKLIVSPLETTHIPTLIIIDALDECKDEEPASAILSILSRYVDQIPFVKFFITGRPEPHIRSGFRLAALRPIAQVLKLHEIERPLVDIDIKLFLQTRLAEIVEDWSGVDLTEDWPLSSDIDILCERAAGFFIFASTIIKFVAQQYRAPQESLALLISSPESTVHEGRAGIDFLYAEILERAFGSKDEEIHQRFRSAVGGALLTFKPLSRTGLSDLLHGSDTPADFSVILNSLPSLLLVPEGLEDPVRIIHKSFPDFLTDPRRCRDERFFVDPPVYHTEILLLCLQLMEERLKRNICSLDDYATLSKVKDLSARKKTHIGDSLEYACHYWTNHLIEIPSNSPRVKEVQDAICGFLTKHLLHWIEVLSLTRSLDTGVSALNNIQQWYILVSCVLSMF